jgi:hypothetical protein
MLNFPNIIRALYAHIKCKLLGRDIYVYLFIQVSHMVISIEKNVNFIYKTDF